MDAKDLHNMDQNLADLRDVTLPMLFVYYQGLINAGFTEDQAFTLTRDFHLRLVSGSLELRGKSDDNS